MDPVILQVIAVVLVIVGLAGTVIPLLPGIAFVFGGLLLAAWADDFQRVGALTLTILGLLTALAIAADLLASALGAKRMGASPRAIVGATLGAIRASSSACRGWCWGPSSARSPASSRRTGNCCTPAAPGWAPGWDSCSARSPSSPSPS